MKLPWSSNLQPVYSNCGGSPRLIARVELILHASGTKARSRGAAAAFKLISKPWRDSLLILVDFTLAIE